MKTKLSYVSSSRGAPMGRPNSIPKDIQTAGKLYLEKLVWVGDYDKGGSYWGNSGGTDIYRCCGKTATNNIEIFTRAKSRDEAKKSIRKVLIGYEVVFYR